MLPQKQTALVTPLAALLVRIGWTIPTAAERAGIAERTMRRCMAGHAATPPTILAWLQRVAEAVEACGMPGH